MMSFIQGFEPSKVYDLAYKALDYRSIRQDMIASNIANISTPFYQPKDIEFQDYLSKQKDLILNPNSKSELPMKRTSSQHIGNQEVTLDSLTSKPTLFFRDGHLNRNDGNSVDLDVETSEMSKNSVMYQALIAALRKHRGIFNYAIDSTRNL